MAVEYTPIGPYVTMSYNSIWGFDRSSSHIALDVDEVVTFEQLCYGMIIANGNECALAIAETMSGSTDVFVQNMNAKAKLLGATNTHFTNPHGLYDAEHYSTPRDIAYIMKAAIENQTLFSMMCTTQYSIPPTNKQKNTRYFNNSFAMLSGKQYYYPGAICGREGYTKEDGAALVSYASANGVELISVLFGESSSDSAYKDTANLFDYFFNNYENKRFSAKDHLEGGLTEIELECAGTIKCRCDGSINVLFEKGAQIDNVMSAITPDNSLSLPIKKGDEIGYVSFSLDGRLLGQIPIYAEETMYVRSDDVIPDNVPSEKKGSVLTQDDKSVFSKILIVIGYILVILLILGSIFVIAVLCIRQQNMRKMQRRRMTRKRSNEFDRSKAFSSTPYDRRK